MTKLVRWEPVQDDSDRKTSRMPVPGGWLYCVIEKTSLKQFVVFVPTPAPDVMLAFEQAERRARAP